MESKIIFQGHVFTLRDDGFYEIKAQFKLDKEDWGSGEDYPGYGLLLNRRGDDEYLHLIALDKQHIDWIQSSYNPKWEAVRVSTAPPYSIMFQEHEFKRRKDGLYETSDVFEFDEKDWNHGYPYIGYVVLLHKQNGKVYPYLISTDDAHADVIAEVDDKSGRVDDIKIAPSVPIGTLL